LPAPIPNAAPGSRISSLDGLRAISIVLVLTNHAIPGTHSFIFRLLFLHAALGVNVFFVISGFLITSLLLKERSETGGISLRLFYIRRALRILPAFCVFVGAVAILNAYGIVRVPAAIWPYVLTYTVNFSTQAPWVLGHLWSLSVEEQFYLLWPLVMAFAKPRVWMSVAVLSVFAGIGIRALNSLAGVALLNPVTLHYAFPFVCGPIAMGCLLAINSSEVRRFITASRFLSGGRMFLVAVPLIAFLDTLDLGAPNPFIAIATSALLTLCVARLVFVPAGAVSRLLNSAPLVGLGKLSYSIYLFQQLFLDSLYRHPAIPLPFPLNLLGALAAASICYWGVESRFFPLRHRFRATFRTA